MCFNIVWPLVCKTGTGLWRAPVRPAVVSKVKTLNTIYQLSVPGDICTQCTNSFHMIYISVQSYVDIEILLDLHVLKFYHFILDF